MPIDLGRGHSLPDHLISEQFVRASGPGGQNVNKVATAVMLRFDLRAADLPAAMKRRMAAAAGRRLTAGGEIVIRAERFRTLAANRQDARARLEALLQGAARAPTYRVKTKPSRAARTKRTDGKVMRGRKKALRGRVRDV
ncbi:MAG: alternative ribosome rescue aminoacyl-tRNA hydrolase ArfB [Pseudomonadota bacterium]